MVKEHAYARLHPIASCTSYGDEITRLLEFALACPFVLVHGTRFFTVACGEKRSSMVDGEMRQPHNINNNNNNNCDNTNKHAQATQHVLSYLDPRTVVELVGQVPEAG